MDIHYNRRNFLQNLGLASLGVGLGVSFNQCKKNNDPEKPFTPFTFMTNPKDPLILRADMESGEVVEYFGIRDNNGIPKTIDIIS